MQGIVELAVELLTSQGRPCFVELVSSYKWRWTTLCPWPNSILSFL